MTSPFPAVAAVVRRLTALLGCRACRYATHTDILGGTWFCNGPMTLQVEAESGRCLSLRSPLPPGLSAVHRTSTGPGLPARRAVQISLTLDSVQ